VINGLRPLLWGVMFFFVGIAGSYWTGMFYTTWQWPYQYTLLIFQTFKLLTLVSIPTALMVELIRFLKKRRGKSA